MKVRKGTPPPKWGGITRTLESMEPGEYMTLTSIKDVRSKQTRAIQLGLKVRQQKISDNEWKLWRV